FSHLPRLAAMQQNLATAQVQVRLEAHRALPGGAHGIALPQPEVGNLPRDLNERFLGEGLVREPAPEPREQWVIADPLEHGGVPLVEIDDLLPKGRYLQVGD